MKTTRMALILALGLLGGCASLRSETLGPGYPDEIADMNSFDVAEPENGWMPYFDNDAPGIPSQGVNWAIRARPDKRSLRPNAVKETYATWDNPHMTRNIQYFWKAPDAAPEATPAG